MKKYFFSYKKILKRIKCFYFNSQMNRNVIIRNNKSSEQVRFQRLSVLVSALTKSNTEAGRGTLYRYRSRERITAARGPPVGHHQQLFSWMFFSECFFSTLLFVTSPAQFRKEFSFNTFLVPTSDTGFPVPDVSNRKWYYFFLFFNNV